MTSENCPRRDETVGVSTERIEKYHYRNITAIILAIFVIISVLSIPVPAQGPGPESLLLDSESERIAQMEIDATSYEVYKVENTLPYASGIEVYSNGEKVTSQNEIEPVFSRIAARRTLRNVDTSVKPSSITSSSAAEQQFTAVAWQVSAREVSSVDMQRLRKIRDSANRIDRLVSPPLSGINTVLDVFEKMKSTGLLGISVWDIAKSAYPQLPEFEDGLIRIQSELTEWNSAAETVTRNVNPAITSIEKARNGQDVVYEDVSNQLKETEEGLQQLQTKSNELSSSLSTASEDTAAVANSLRNSRIPGGFVGPIEQLSQRLNQASNGVNSFSSQVGEGKNKLAQVRSGAQQRKQSYLEEWESERSSLEKQWKSRKSAETKVYGTLGGSGIGIVGIVLIGRHLL